MSKSVALAIFFLIFAAATAVAAAFHPVLATISVVSGLISVTCAVLSLREE